MMSPDIRASILGGLALALVTLAPGRADEPGVPGARGRLTMSRAVVCLAVEGYGAYSERPDRVLTRDEKLVLYFEPRGHRFEETDQGYRLHLTEDVQIRRRGTRAVLWEKTDLAEYEATSVEPPVRIYMMNEIALKGLGPGDYELTIRLHDRIGQGTAEQVVRFSVGPAGDSPRSPAAPEPAPAP